MTDVIVHEDDSDQDSVGSAHEAAVNEGQTMVHAANAEASASEAQAAADAATAALESQAEVAQTAIQAAEVAHSEAEKTQATSEAMYELMQQQNTTLQALAAKLLAPPEPEPEPEVETEETVPASDEPPARKEHWYYRKMGKRLCTCISG